MVRFLPLVVLVACTTAPAAQTSVEVPQGPSFAMDFARPNSLYDAPFPSDDLLKDGHVDLHQWQNPDQVTLIDQCLALLNRDARGFAQTGAIYFRAGAALDPATLPALATSVTDEASVFVILAEGVDPRFPKQPAQVGFLADGGPMGDKNLLAILPLQGAPLQAGVRYAAVVTRKVRYADGSQPPAMSAALQAKYASVIEFHSLHPDDIAAMTVFKTDDRAGQMADFYTSAYVAHPVTPLASAPTLTETYHSYCVFESKLDVPVYQHGTPPYNTAGGDWQLDGAGKPVFDHMETARIWFTVPRQPMPQDGWPIVQFIGTGGGGERPLIERGVAVSQGFTTAVKPGTGPAQEFARVGWAGVQFDGTLEGIRNTTHGNEDFLLFNVFNAAALRDNIRQSALEQRLVADRLADVSFDVSACAGATGPFHAGKFRAIMGHSMGASILPLVVTTGPPVYQAAILSGAGSSYIMNVMDKLLPLPVKPVAEGLLGYDVRSRPLTPFDPALTLFQWAVESSDSQIYGPQVGGNVLMLQGLVDHYILPSIANAFSMAAGLDLAGPELDMLAPELIALHQPFLADILPLFGKKPLPWPVTGNASSGTRTAVVVQNMGDAIEDGHEANFQTEHPKQLYRCLLADIAAGKVPTLRDTSNEACWLP